MTFQGVCRVRRPRRLAIGLIVAVLLVLVLLARHLISPHTRSLQVKLQVKTGSHGEQVDDDVEDWRQSVMRRHHGFRDKSVKRLHINADDSDNDKDLVVADKDSSLDATRNGGIQTQEDSEISQLPPDTVLGKIADQQEEEQEEDRLVNDRASDERVLESDPVPQLSDEVSRASSNDSPLPVEAQYIQDKNMDGALEQNTGLHADKDNDNQVGLTNDDDRESDVALPVLTSGHASSGTFIGDLERVVNFNKVVILSVIDAGYVTMAMNFFRTSVANLGLKNFLLVCTDKMAVMQLRREGIPCSPYTVPEVTKRESLKRDVIKHGGGNHRRHFAASDFGTVDYYQKSNAKTSVILTALEKGYSILIVDVDVVMFKNPFPFFNCTTCDVHFQMDREMYNSGFAFIRPTQGSLRLYRKAWDLYATYQKAHDQIYLNMAINRLNQNDVIMGYHRRVSNLNAVRIQSLPVGLFPCGAYYFQRANRMFENQPRCEDCVMAHNNYIGSVAAKIYRFRENLLWTVDENQYYSNTSARYFTYSNPFDFGLRTVDMELAALKSALAIAMASDRLLILPTFRCCARNCRLNKSNPRIILLPEVAAGDNGNRFTGTSAMECSDPSHSCSLLSLLKLNKFDQVFGSRYREHSFLRNRIVPANIKLDVSPISIFINVSETSATSLANDSSHVIVSPTNRDRGATLSEVVRWMDERRNETVVRFHSLYGATVDWASDESYGLKLKEYFQAGFACSEYEQWDDDLLDLAKQWPENKYH